MTRKNETIPLLMSLLITAGLIGGGYWWLTRKAGLQISFGNANSPATVPTTSASAPSPTPSLSSPALPATGSTGSTAPTTIATGTVIRIDGSTSMVQMTQALKQQFELQFTRTQLQTAANGSQNGIKALLAGTVDLAASSRPLTPQEQSAGLVTVPVTQDAIAVVVGANNPFRRGLALEQVVGIFTGNITQWSALGGPSQPIRVINRPAVSGTHQLFRHVALNDANFGTGANVVTMEQDATTPILRALGTDGMSYATYTQVVNQLTVRTVAINGLTPEASNYPFKRTLAYVYRNPPSAAVQAFLDFVASPAGQQVITESQIVQ